jgi:DNA-binding transcriptional LysR family regulator
VPDAAFVVRSDAFEVQLEAITAGVGVGMLTPHFLEIRPLAAVKLTRALALDVATSPLGELWMVAHRELRNVPRIAACWEFFADRFAGEAPAIGKRAHRL